MKFLLPWVVDTSYYFYIQYARPVLGGNISTPNNMSDMVWKEKSGRTEHWRFREQSGFVRYKTKEECMEFADKCFVSRGYVLITEDQVERYTKKLAILL
jgi:hypothetical protein